MFDFAWSEIMVIALVALVVIGPKDLPRVLRTLGKWASKARVVAREFQSSVEQMIRESELEDVRREMEKATSANLTQEIEQSIDPKGEVQAALAGTAGSTEINMPEATQAASDGAVAAVAAPTETAPTETAATPAPEAAPPDQPSKTPTPV
jgi:sec-independent protein translocase protein TatB